MLTFAHGPPTGEWHHLPAVILAFPTVTFLIYWLRQKLK